MLIDIGLTAAGLVLLVLGADHLVRGAAALALAAGVSTLLIGLTVVAIGTSLPELVVSLRAALGDSVELAVGNIVGSNIANILLILGAAAAVGAVRCRRRVLLRDGGAMLAATALFVVLGLVGEIGTLYALLGLTAALAYLTYSYRSDQLAEEGGIALPAGNLPVWRSLLALLIGLIGVAAGGELLVRGAIDLARLAGVSEEVIGLTLVAFGTYLPELATSVVAAARRQGDIALGNVIGSNIVNLLLVIGLTSLVVPFTLPEQILRFDIWVMSAATLVLLLVMALTTRLPRFVGVLFLCGYGGYILAQVAG